MSLDIILKTKVDKKHNAIQGTAVERNTYIHTLFLNVIERALTPILTRIKQIQGMMS